MPWCVVVGCRNNLKATKRSGKDVSYHIFPKNLQRRSAWIKTLNRTTKFNADSSYICSEHFIPDDFECYSLKEELLNIKVKRQLKKTAIPSINIPKISSEAQSKISVNLLNNQNSTVIKTTDSMHPIKELNHDAIPTLNSGVKVTDNKHIEDESVKIERKKLVDKLLADYEEQHKNEGHLKGIMTKYPGFFSPKINPNAKLGDKLKLLKAIDNPETFFLPKKRKTSFKSNSESLEPSILNNLPHKKDQLIQVSAVKGGIMLHALPQKSVNATSSSSEKNCIDEEEEIIIVTEDEASYIDLTSYEEQQKENNTEVIIVTNLKETEDTLKHVENVPDKYSAIINDSNRCCVENHSEKNVNQSTPLCTAKVSLSEEKGCQVLIPCKGCEHRSLKINKLLRERTKLLRDLNQNGSWKDPDEITTLRRMNGVLSLLLMQCVGEKYGKKSSIRIDLVQDSIERIDRGWSMQDTSETLCQVLSVNAYDEFARTFEIINET